jgi:hypothetical protein
VDPWDALADACTATLPEGVSIYSAPTNQLVPPALVIRPDNPWVEVSRDYCLDQQRYVGVAVVTASSPQSGLSKLYAIFWGVREAIKSLEGWDWVNIGSPVIDESTGSAYLAAPIRLTYKNSQEPQEAS